MHSPRLVSGNEQLTAGSDTAAEERVVGGKAHEYFAAFQVPDPQCPVE